MTILRFFTAALAALSLIGDIAHAGPADLDPTFGAAGRAAITGYSWHALALQADGRILVAGEDTLSTPPAFAVARYLPAGTLDSSFGNGGIARAALSTAQSRAFAVAVQPDGKVVLAGAAFVNNSPFMALARFQSNGTLDATFGSGGTLVTNTLATGRDFSPANVLVQGDGKLVVSGPSGAHSIALRLNANGTTDTAFGSSGTATLNDVEARSATLQADGKLLVTGLAPVGGRVMAVVRLLPDGSLDPAFGSSGRATVSFNAIDDTANGIALQPDGKILVVGATRPDGVQQDVAVARLDAAGALDSSFGTGGKVSTAVGPGNDDATRVAVQPDGLIVVAGESRDAQNVKDFMIVRYTAAGALDTTFGNGGKQTFALTTGDDTAWGVAVQGTDSKIVAAGETSTGGAVIRLLGSDTSTLFVTPSSLDFGSQSMGTTSPAQTVTISNTGSSAVTASVTSSNTQFTAGGTCGSVAAGASCAIAVRFSPAIAAGALGSSVAVSATLTVQTSGGTRTVALGGSADKSLVAHYYRSILRRAPDSAGKSFWESEAQRVANLGANVNETWFAMAQNFYDSAEYTAFGRNATEYVRDLYTTFFNRDADTDGLGYWTGQMAGGMPREVVLVSFMFSTEFTQFSRAIFGNTAARAEVDTVIDFYRGLLARLPDSSGFNFWVGRFRAAQCQSNAAVVAEVESISSAFANSPEYAARARTNAQYVGDLYNAFLRRGGDLEGVRFWINQLDTGARTRDQLRRDFIASPEFNARVTAIVNQGCRQ